MSNNIKQGFPTPPKDCFKINVRSITYNHAQYIEDCLNGVAMQKTDFPFVHHVIDDCSTDGEQDVIKAWIERECDIDNADFYDNDICTITIAKHRINSNYTVVAYFLKQNMFRNPQKGELYKLWDNACPYIAFCEGDDYWKLPNNLKTKVDWLESHDDYSACMSNVDIFMQSPYPLRKIIPVKKDCTLPIENIISRQIFVQISGFITRRQLFYDRVDNWGTFAVGDYPSFVFAAYLGKVRMFQERFSCYRVGVPGSHNTQSFKKKTDEKAVYRILENSHYMYETLNKYTQFKYDDLFKNRWYVSLFRYQKNTHNYSSARKTFSRIDNKVKLFGLKWTVGHYIGLYLRLFDTRIIK